MSKLPQMRERRGARSRSRLEGGGQEAAAAWKEGDKRPQMRGKEGQCAKTRKPLHRRRSTRYPVNAVQDVTADAWKEKKKEYRSDEIHCGGGARFGPRGVRELYAASQVGL